MRLDKTKPGGRPPLRTVAEIAEALGIPISRLVWALQHESAPKPKLHWKTASHQVSKHVWYDPKEVVRWFREFDGSDLDKAAVRREYHQEYNARRKATEGK